MLGAVELGGTKCIVAIGKSPNRILSKKVISTKDPESTFSDIVSFFDGEGEAGSRAGRQAGRPNFGGLVLGCIDAGLCKQILSSSQFCFGDLQGYQIRYDRF